jgi:hypothetical protein
VTEAEWTACEDPLRMFAWLRGPQPGLRPLLLFGCACCRRARRALKDPRSLRAVEAVERYADGQADGADLVAALTEAATAAKEAPHYDPVPATAALELVLAALAGRGRAAPEHVLGHLVRSFQAAWPRWAGGAGPCHLLRCTFGNPFRPAPVPDPAWLAWGGGAVAKLSRAAYRHRSLPSGLLDDVRLAVLADALEEAGCAEEGVLRHLRSGGEHVRGCHVLDRLLGRGRDTSASC